MRPAPLAVAVATAAASLGTCGTATRPAAPPTSATTSVPAATSSTTAARPAPPYPVMERTLGFADPTRPTVSHGRTVATDRPLPTQVWLPATPGRWPLIIFASGYAVDPETVSALLMSWAARGYVVAAPEFPLEDPATFGHADLDEGDLGNEPADLRFVLRSLLGPADPIRAAVDGQALAVAGHSDGAEVALAVATQGGLPSSVVVRAVIVMSGQPVAGSVAGNPPMLVTQGDADTINAPANGFAVYQQARPPKYLLTLLGAGHLPPLEAGSTWLPTIEAVTVDFLDAYVGGDASDATRLQAAGDTPRISTLQVTPAG